MHQPFSYAAAAFLLAALGSGLVQAKVSEEEAARLGKDLKCDTKLRERVAFLREGHLYRQMNLGI